MPRRLENRKNIEQGEWASVTQDEMKIAILEDIPCCCSEKWQGDSQWLLQWAGLSTFDHDLILMLT